jgi:hypothetical protein
MEGRSAYSSSACLDVRIRLMTNATLALRTSPDCSMRSPTCSRQYLSNGSELIAGVLKYCFVRWESKDSNVFGNRGRDCVTQGRGLLAFGKTFLRCLSSHFRYYMYDWRISNNQIGTVSYFRNYRGPDFLQYCELRTIRIICD